MLERIRNRVLLWFTKRYLRHWARRTNYALQMTTPYCDRRFVQPWWDVLDEQEDFLEWQRLMRLAPDLYRAMGGDLDDDDLEYA